MHLRCSLLPILCHLPPRHETGYTIREENRRSPKQRRNPQLQINAPTKKIQTKKIHFHAVQLRPISGWPRHFVERLWKSVKYEEIYLHGYDTVSVARQALNRYFDFYNRRRPHSTLDGKTPDTAYFNLSKPPLAAAA